MANVSLSLYLMRYQKQSINCWVMKLLNEAHGFDLQLTL